jgi:S-adenosylmethionine:tRNA ribosyltransferase-isomerase
MDISKFLYYLPKERIAQKLVSPRDHSKLLYINRKNKTIKNYHFFNLIDILDKNDVLVLNKTKVFPARIYGKKETGGKVEFLLVEKIKNNIWEVLTKPGINIGSKVFFDNFEAKILKRNKNTSLVSFDVNEKILFKSLEKIGHTPIPPYINGYKNEQKLKKDYQTVYAKNIGSIAAPTAGFHFTEKLIKKLKEKGVQIEFVTLHVGLGTFLPIKGNDISKHKMHSEYYSLNKKTADKLNKAKENNKRIISVGTTTARVLETCSNKKGYLKEASGKTDIFIYPPYKFRFIDGLITNFHLPESTLLALVSAFVSFPNTKYKFTSFKSSLIGKAYTKAIKENYRFYSFGDSSIIL